MTSYTNVGVGLVCFAVDQWQSARFTVHFMNGFFSSCRVLFYFYNTSVSRRMYLSFVTSFHRYGVFCAHVSRYLIVDALNVLSEYQAAAGKQVSQPPVVDTHGSSSRLPVSCMRIVLKQLIS